jgi:PIF1-like helicase
MHLHHDELSQLFAQWLLEIGSSNTTPSPPQCLNQNKLMSIKFPNHMLCRGEEDLIEAIYGSIKFQTLSPSSKYFYERVILAPLNEQVQFLNNHVLNLLPGDECVFNSADSQSFEPGAQHDMHEVPLEFLHTLNVSSIPLAHLVLKISCPIIILRNIDPKRGLCNGTCTTILRMSNRILEVKLLGGDHDGEIAMIPCIMLSPSLTGIDFAIKMKQRQFCNAPLGAMTLLEYLTEM